MILPTTGIGVIPAEYSDAAAVPDFGTFCKTFEHVAAVNCRNLLLKRLDFRLPEQGGAVIFARIPVFFDGDNPSGRAGQHDEPCFQIKSLVYVRR